ncbi:zinc transporter ZIP4-like [Mugil cephalus]|uniref:zinc transporter ZIP4-like n=1 Tax=Mugil cephalus TaxID=48193 RepID=UPI001FB71143|nr:zinc transporter ZIP4-like [Mugil cephalus]
MFSSLLLLFLFSGWSQFGSVSGSPALEEVYGDVVSVLSPGQHHLTGESLRSLFNTLEKRVQCAEVSCEKCDLAGSVHQLIGNSSIHRKPEAKHSTEDITVDVSQFTSLAAGCVLYLSAPGLVCNATSQGKWKAEAEHFLHNLVHRDHHQPHHDHDHMHTDVEALEALLQELRHHYEPSHHEMCVTASDIMRAVHGDHTQIVGAVLGRVLYHALLGDCFRVLPEESFFLDFIMGRLTASNYFTVEDLETLMRSLNIGHEHVEDHTDHDHRSQRRWKSSDHEHHEENSTWEQYCFSAEELILIYDLPENSSASSALARPDMAQLSPALIQQILSGACAHVTEPVQSDGLSRTERYLYATLANVVITLTSMFGIVVLLFTSCTNVFQLCIQFCISLAVGTLTGDALLHLLPMFLGLHVHSDNDSHHDHSHEEGTPDYTYKMLVLVAGIYCFYLMETLFSLITYKNHHHHQHHHAEESEPHHCDHGRVLEMYQQERKQKQQSASKADLVDYEDVEEPQSKKRTREQRLLPYMITIGDGIHNFADGLAIGAAFSLSWRSGLATSVAVFCHELPHELGDFAILLHSGLSVRKALLLNVSSAMVSFIGLYIALSVATDLATKQWIAAITAGLFLYVGLVDMMPNMVHASNKRPWLMFLLQNVGLVTGWVLLLLLSLYEEKISF